MIKNVTVSLFNELGDNLNMLLPVNQAIDFALTYVGHFCGDFGMVSRVKVVTDNVILIDLNECELVSGV